MLCCTAVGSSYSLRIGWAAIDAHAWKISDVNSQQFMDRYSFPPRA